MSAATLLEDIRELEKTEQMFNMIIEQCYGPGGLFSGESRVEAMEFIINTFIALKKSPWFYELSNADLATMNRWYEQGWSPSGIENLVRTIARTCQEIIPSATVETNEDVAHTLENEG